MSRCSARLLFAALVCTWTPQLGAESPIDVGARLELMVDDHLVSDRRAVSFELIRPQRAEKVLVPEFPWEGDKLGHVSILRDGERYRMYYRGRHEPGYSWSENIYTCYAESSDGVRWSKPKLGLVEWQGSKANNILLKGQRGAYLAPFIDDRPGTPPEERYKSFAGNPPYAMASSDGLTWRPLVDKPVLPKPRFGIALRDPFGEGYLAYTRAWRVGADGARLRNIAVAQSDDFRRWSHPQLLEVRGAPPSHLYWNTALPYYRAPHLLLAFPMRLREYVDEASGERRDWTDVVLMVSRDGKSFYQYGEAYVRPGMDADNWRPHVNMMAYGMAPTSDRELSMYLTNAAGGKRHLRRLTLRTDGFVALRAKLSGGEFTTKPIRFTGEQLSLNFATSAAGAVQVEILRADGSPVPSFELKNCREMVGDSVRRTVQWRGNPSLAPWAGKPVRLRFVLRDADLFAWQFGAKN